VVKPASVEEYLAGVPEKPRAALQSLRRIIQCGRAGGGGGHRLPDAGFRWRGRALVGYAAFKEHCSFFR